VAVGRTCIITAVALILVAAGLLADPAFAKGVSTMTKEELLAVLDSSSLVIIEGSSFCSWDKVVIS